MTIYIVEVTGSIFADQEDFYRFNDPKQAIQFGFDHLLEKCKKAELNQFALFLLPEKDKILNFNVDNAIKALSTNKQITIKCKDYFRDNLSEECVIFEVGEDSER